MIPRDKLQHAAVGLAVALFSMAIWAAASHLALVPLAGMPGAVALGGLIAGLTKEGADWIDNRAHPGMHGVDLLDALATAAPCLVIAAAAQQVLVAAAL